ncbi:GFA family protein [Rhizorhapis sp. SPR117]|uniref:GFA family protein n=1 Tax=Rhizorhapis sp. SPR117 TaxID=2912611 RepID=UPI001F480EAE|nr:GFA family protein [Rhizorhapis sp. SPR117]
MTVTASCHCGNVRLSFPAMPDEAMSCNCSHCSKKGFLLAFFPADQVTIEAGTDKVSTYTFNKHVIQHRFCPTCGVQVYAEGKMPDGSATTAINLRCAEEVDLSALNIREVDGRSF